MSDDQELVKSGVEAVLKPFADLLDKIAGPAADEIGLTVRDTVRVFRIKRQVRLFQRVKEILDKAGIQPQKVPLKILFPILENASIEEDDQLQDCWAALLANNASGRYIEVIFPEILHQLSAADAILLQMCFHETFNHYNRMSPPWHQPVTTIITAWEYRFRQNGNSPDFPVSDLSLDNLLRLGLLSRTSTGDPHHSDDYRLTHLGYQFMGACEDPSVTSKLSRFQEHRGP